MYIRPVSALSFNMSKNKSCADTFFFDIDNFLSAFKYNSSNSFVPHASYNSGTSCGENNVISSSFINLSLNNLDNCI